MGWTALLDACVLFPVATRDLLLRGAHGHLYEVRWSSEILAEVRASLMDAARCTPGQAEHLIETMTAAFPEALVQGYEGLASRMGNEPGDRHVLAAALIARADVIVTDNLRHFPYEVREPLGIEVQTADEFLSAAIDLAPRVMAEAFLQQVDDFHRPALTPSEALSRLDSRLPAFASRLRRVDVVRDVADLHHQWATGAATRPKRGQGRDPLRSSRPLLRVSASTAKQSRLVYRSTAKALSALGQVRPASR